MKKLIYLLFAGMLIGVVVHAQNFKGKQQSQERAIKSARKSHAISSREYEKLMHEQDIIKDVIHEAAADGYWTAHEKNTVASKLDRAARRLMRYKHNSEVY